MWSIEKCLQFIEDYHAACCLWDITSADFKNRLKRKFIVQHFAKKYEATELEIEKKIVNLKAKFRREHKKLITCNKSGSSPLKCSWFAYEYLQFLLPATESKGDRNTTWNNNNGIEGNKKLDEATSGGENLTTQKSQREEASEIFKTPNSMRSRQSDETVQEAAKCMHTLSQIESLKDEYAVYGEHVANRLRNCKRQRSETSIAQHYIDEILFRLEMGMYASHTPLSYPPQELYFQNAFSITSSTCFQCLDYSTPTPTLHNSESSFKNSVSLAAYSHQNNLPSEPIPPTIGITYAFDHA